MSHQHRRDRSGSSRHHREHHNKRSPSPKRSKPDVVADQRTNLLNFSFCDNKYELNRVLNGFRTRDQLIDDTNDLWLFVAKYESLLKRSGQCILPDPTPPTAIDNNVQSAAAAITKAYVKSLQCSIEFSVPFEELLGRLSSDQSRIDALKLRQFLQIVVHYLDFKQREKFQTLRKLRAFQAGLPVAQYKSEIIEAVRQERVVLIAGDTGCGKSTQVPQYLAEAGFECVACTQPRRIACISLSKRVAHEMLCEYGTEVGYQIRFERSKSARTKILFITEGLLLRQVIRYFFF